MARIAFAWELGGELGHAVNAWSTASVLAARGHQVAFLFRELHNLRFLPGSIDGFDVFQAPVTPDEGAGEGIPLSFADILRGCGYRDAGALGERVRGWRDLLARWRPDLMVEDFAPTALLAARLEKVRRVRCSNGFSVPPRTVPIPAFRFDAAPDPARIAASEAGVLAVVNEVLDANGAAPLANLAQLFEAEEDFLCTFPELDHYGNRPPAGYWGPNLQVAAGETVEWRGLSGRRVFVYVKRHLRHVDALIDGLVENGCRVVAFIPDLEPERRARLEGPGRIVANRAVRLDSVLTQCELVVSHGGTLAPGSLMRGIPQLVFPSQYEQYLTGVRLEQLGVGRLVGPEAAEAEVRRVLREMLEDPRPRLAARAFPKRYPDFSPREQRRRIVARVEQLALRR